MNMPAGRLSIIPVKLEMNESCSGVGHPAIMSCQFFSADSFVVVIIKVLVVNTIREKMPVVNEEESASFSYHIV